jgi:hypothetical protein
VRVWSGAETKKIKLIFLTVPFNGLVQTSVSGEASAWWSGTELRSGAEPEERGKCLGYLCESVVWSGDEKMKLNFSYRSVQWIGPDVCERRGERVVWNGAEVWSGA